MQQPSPFRFAQQPRLAVLIDAENISFAGATRLMAHVADRGNATVRRAYADWSNPHLTSWRQVLSTLAIRPVQQFHYRRGKNASDSALIMDAMELLHTRRVDGFCIVSSDSDYTGLAGRIREAGLAVYGFGKRDAAASFKAACNAFVFLDKSAAD